MRRPIGARNQSKEKLRIYIARTKRKHAHTRALGLPQHGTLGNTISAQIPQLAIHMNLANT